MLLDVWCLTWNIHHRQLAFSSLQTHSSHQGSSDSVWITVGRWTTILKVSVSIVIGGTWNTDGGGTGGNPIGELVDGSGLVESSQTTLVVLSSMWIVVGNVLWVDKGKLVDGRHDLVNSSWVSHLFSGEVGVASGSIPVSLDWFTVEGGDDSKLLSDTLKQVTGDPQLISHLNSLAWSNLELPLSWHDLGVGSRDLDTGVKAGTVVSLNDVTSVDLVGSNSTVVWSLWSWESVLWPSEWMSIDIEKSVLLLHSEPWVLVGGLLHDLLASDTEVGGGWLLLVIVGLAHHQLVLSLPEWIWIDGNWLQVDIGVGSLSLSGGGSVKVPDWELLWVSWLEIEGSGLGTDVLSGSINPDVEGLVFSLLVQVQKLLQDGLVGGELTTE